MKRVPYRHGRFLQPDTIVPSPRDPQSLNRYSYVLNSPLRYTDPTGRYPLPNLDPTYCLLGIQCSGGPGLAFTRLPTLPGGQGPTGGGGINLPGPDWVWKGSSFAASVLPLSSQFCAGQAIFFGTQCITQDDLGDLDRGLESLALIPGGKAGSLLKKLRLLRFADEASDVARVEGGEAVARRDTHEQ